MNKRILTSHKGVYQRESTEEIFKGKPNLCFDITYKRNGKKIFEKIGWLSEGFTAKLAADIRAQRMKQLRFGEELPKDKVKAPLFTDVADKYFLWAETNLTRGGSLERYSGPNPIKFVKLPVPQNQRERWLTKEEAGLLLERLKVRTPLWHDITLLGLHTGLRASEIFSLRGHDLDFEQESINVDDTKNKRPRKAFMTTAVKEILLLRKPDNPGDLVFKNNKGEKITEVSHTFDRIVEELGFNKGITDTRQKVVFHTTRHTFASWLAIQGTPLHVIAELTGHRQMNMVQRYSHLSPDVKRKAVKQMESGFKQSQNEKVVNI